MSNSDALRELQARLAQRLQDAQTEVPQQSWLAVECAGVGLLFPLAQAGEIFPVGAVTRVPHTQPWFAGVANLRGALQGVVDLGRFLGLAGAGSEVRDGSRDARRLLALNPTLGLNCAVLVDKLAGLRNAGQLREERGEPAAAHGGSEARPPFALSRWRDAEGRVWQELSLAALASHEQFLAVAQA